MNLPKKKQWFSLYYQIIFHSKQSKMIIVTKTKKGRRLILLVPFGLIEIGIDITDIEIIR